MSLPGVAGSSDRVIAGGGAGAVSWWQKKWGVGAIAFGSLIVGVGLGGSSQQSSSPEAAPEPRPTVTVTETVRPEPQPAVTVTTRDDAPPAQESSAGSDGVYEAGAYTLSNVDVRCDFVDDFEIRARGTNNNSREVSVSIAATLFHQGSIVATLDATVSDWPAGQTRTLEFITSDDCGPWDEVEFQVEFEF